MILISLATAAASLPCSLAAQDAAPDPTPISRSDIGAEIDRSIHWLRKQQDAESGAYGDFATTVWALLALSGSPRGYGPS